MSSNANPSVLLVEDHTAVRLYVASLLSNHGYRVSAAATAETAKQLAEATQPDLYLVDLGLPDADGLHFIAWLRQWTSRPVVVVSGRNDHGQKVQALDAGADDYVTKPFDAGELLARLRAHRRRDCAAPPLAQRLRFGDFQVSLESRKAQRAGQPAHLTATQWRLLEVLARHAHLPVTSETILRQVWEGAPADQLHYVRIYVRQLRLLMEPDPSSPRYLLTEVRIGYRLVPDPD